MGRPHCSLNFFPYQTSVLKYNYEILYKKITFRQHKGSGHVFSQDFVSSRTCKCCPLHRPLLAAAAAAAAMCCCRRRRRCCCLLLLVKRSSFRVSVNWESTAYAAHSPLDAGTRLSSPLPPGRFHHRDHRHHHRPHSHRFLPAPTRALLRFCTSSPHVRSRQRNHHR